MSGDQTLLRQAQVAMKAGNIQEARYLLEQAVRLSPNDYRPWLWLAGVTPSAQTSLAYLDRAAALNPQNATIQQARQWAEQRLAQEKGNAPAAVSTPTAASVSTASVALSVLAVAAVPAAMSAPAAMPLSAMPAASSSPVASQRRWWLLAAVVLLLCLLGIGASRVARQWLPPDVPLAAAAVDTPAPVNGEVGVTVDAPATAVPAEAVATSVVATANPQPTTAGSDVSDADQPVATASPATATPGNRLPSKRAVAAASTRPTWTPTPTPSPTPSPSPTPLPTPVPTATPVPPTPVPVTSVAGIPIGYGEPWVDVNLTTQTLVAYRGTEAVFSTLISSGTWAYPTVTGQFRIYLRYEAQDMNGYLLGYDYYLPNVPYVMYFYEDYALHGTYWHNNFGTPMSHGCVNLATGDAQWLFNFTTVGTLVNVHY